jgi:hypothetical protein
VTLPVILTAASPYRTVPRRSGWRPSLRQPGSRGLL